jgi:hypothetical protein
MSDPYTPEEMKEFRGLVEASESRLQTERIRSRLEMPRFIKKVGKEKCDAMFFVLQCEACNHKNHNHDNGWCHMFKESPNAACTQFEVDR